MFRQFLLFFLWIREQIRFLVQLFPIFNPGKTICNPRTLKLYPGKNIFWKVSPDTILNNICWQLCHYDSLFFNNSGLPGKFTTLQCWLFFGNFPLFKWQFFLYAPLPIPIFNKYPSSNALVVLSLSILPILKLFFYKRPLFILILYCGNPDNYYLTKVCVFNLQPFII